ncbi:hypothetical protein Tco_1056906 [Tanacetum coccineum]|uniref:Uncharacterized protein n=1 Tax=Tanacetum coccineum TaxID=301880 RepID=A0ABQ5H4L6_9ASTR
MRIEDSNKRKWEDQQGNNHHQQQNRRQEAAKVYVAAPAKGRGYAGNLPWCNRLAEAHQSAGSRVLLVWYNSTKLGGGHQKGIVGTSESCSKRQFATECDIGLCCGNHGHIRSVNGVKEPKLRKPS